MPEIVVNAALCKGGNVLLAKRAAHRKAYPNLWSLPGGHVEAGETLDAALVRELAEEIGVVPTRFRSLLEIPDPNTARLNTVTYHIYVVEEWDGDPVLLGNEHSDLRWFELQAAAALPDLALDAYRLVLESSLGALIRAPDKPVS